MCRENKHWEGYSDIGLLISVSSFAISLFHFFLKGELNQ